MSESLYPPMTEHQRTILRELRDQQKLTRDEIATILGLTVKAASDEISPLILRGAVRGIDQNTFELGQEAARYLRN